MKIYNEQLQALQQQNEAKAKPKAGGVFDALLSEELAEATGASEIAKAASPIGVGSITAPMAVSPVNAVEKTPEAAALATITSSIEAMLGNLDDYADALSSPEGANLKKAYGLLQSMDGSIEALRQNAPDLAATNAGLASLVDEIAVITRAETVKMNRGDYL